MLTLPQIGHRATVGLELVGLLVLVVLVGAVVARDRLRPGLRRALRRIEAWRAGAWGPRLSLAGQAALLLWFAYWSWRRLGLVLAQGTPVGQDIRIYARAVEVWLAGGDPWSAGVLVSGHMFSYAGSPATLLMMVPFAWLPEDAVVAVWVALSAVAALFIVRRLRLPPLWLLFPPLTEALYSANPQLAVLALLLVGAGPAGAMADSVAVALKVYAAIPVLGERSVRRIAAAAALTVVSFALVPGLWLDYLRAFGQVSARLAHQASMGWSAFYFPVLFVIASVALVALAWRDRRVAGWLAVPALWPASEFHYSTMAMPVMTPILAVLLAVPMLRLPPVAITIDIAWRLAGPRLVQGARSWIDGPTAGAPSAGAEAGPGRPRVSKD